MFHYLAGMRTIAAMLVWRAVLAGCGRDARLGSVDEGQEPAAARKVSSSQAAVIAVLGARG